MTLSQEQLLTTLMGLGLTRIDSQVYLFLAKRGPQKGNALIGALNAPGGQVYRSLKNLQSKGIITVTMEHPARFSAIPFDAFLESVHAILL